MTRVLLIAFTCCIGLASCTSLDTYYKPGGTVDRLNRDTLACEVKALKDVPATTVLRRNPPIYIPGKRVCDAKGNCHTGRGYYVPGGVERYDPNDGLRLRVERQCMADKGYAPVSIPACSDAVARAATPGATRRLPALNEGSCVIRNSDGTFQIVTQG